MNIVEILKKCPIGTKLYSPICGECRLEKIYGNDGFDVITNSATFGFSYDGRYIQEGEVCIFPSKEERDWNKFQIPYVYKNGDIVYLKTKNGRKYIIIFENVEDDYICTHIDLSVGTTIWFSGSSFNIEDIEEHRFATEKEKQKLFKELKVNGYKWNEETNTVDKLIKPKFKDGDILFVESVYPFIVIYKENENEECFYKYVAIKNYPDCTHIFDGNEPLCHKKGVSKIRFATKEEKQKLFQVIEANGYKWNDETKTLDKLVKSKFDISTLVPFESKVLVRDDKEHVWKPAIFGGYINDCLRNYKYIVIGEVFHKYLIPYEGNEDLLCTYNDCDNYYKTWE